MSIEKSKRKKWIVVAAVVVVAVIAVVIGLSSATKQETTTQGKVAFIEKRAIANSISGNGVVEAATKQEVTGGSLGMEIKSVLVEEGDEVAVGDIICIFDTTDQEKMVKDLQKQVADVEERRVEANEEQDRLQIEAVYYQNTTYSRLVDELEDAEVSLKNAKTELANVQKEYEDAKSAAGGSLPIQEEASYTSLITQKKSAVTTAETRVDSIESQIETVLEQDNWVYVERKEENDKNAKETTDTLNEQIAEYQEQIDKGTVRATVAGVVTSLNVKEGTTFTGSVIATIETVDQFVVEAQIEEYDIPDIQTGMKVLIKTDATRDQELEGVVSYIAPRATNSGSSSSGGFTSLMSGMDTSSFSSGSGSATYLVKISLVEPNERLRLGMNAKVSIVTEERVEAWSVPYDAVYTREDGSSYLEKVAGEDEDGNVQTEELNVQLGLQGSYYVEVISDEIKEGTQILIPDAQGNSSIEELLNMMGADAGI